MILVFIKFTIFQKTPRICFKKRITRRRKSDIFCFHSDSSDKCHHKLDDDGLGSDDGVVVEFGCGLSFHVLFRFYQGIFHTLVLLYGYLYLHQ